MILAIETKNAMLRGVANMLNVGTNATLSIYVGETLAVELAMQNPVEFSVTGGVLTFKTPPEALAIASGVPTAAKLRDSTGVLVAEFDVGTELTLDKDKIYMGGYVGLNSLAISI